MASAQLHVVDGRAVACYSRRGGDLLRSRGMAWLLDIAWPFDADVLDLRGLGGRRTRGHPRGVLGAPPAGRLGSMSLVFFDLLAVDAQSVMREPWRDRRKRLADLLERARLPRVGIVPVTDDAAQLYETWVGMGGEGVVLKEPDAPYRPGARSSAWLKLKPKLTLDVVVTGGSELGLRHVPAVGQARWVGQALAQHRRDEGHGKDPGGSLSVPSLVP